MQLAWILAILTVGSMAGCSCGSTGDVPRGRDAGGGIDGGPGRVDAGPGDDGGSPDDGGIGDDGGSEDDACVPTDEACNGGDDDCDGTVDEALGTSTCGVGGCERTVETCAGGVPQTCMVGLPEDESCNGIDDDCDGSVDDGVVRDCYAGPVVTRGVGVCVAGIQTCSDGAFGACTGEVVPSADVCNGLDDDCDGSTDELLGSTTCGSGACARTVASCVGGAPQTCTPGTPGTETCDGTDEDCDGSVDDGVTRRCYGGPPGTAGVGPCVAGTETCTAGAFGVCAGEVRPADEACNGRDDDCDGSVDDSLGSTTCGTGACRRTVMNCVAGTPQTCVPGTAGLETCNGIDDDCDGVVDDGITRACYTGPPGTVGVGRCEPGIETCSAGMFGACTGQTTPAPESCDGLDNDCDGMVDDGVPSISCGVGPCRRTVPGCVGGMTGVCTPGAPGTETCNGIDDDCDGTIDDGAVPANDARTDATPVSMTAATRMLAADTTCARNDTTGSCGCTDGADVFYTFTLTAPTIVYADTIGATFDTSLFLQTATGANITVAGIPGGAACNDDDGLAPCTTGRQSQIAARLDAGTYYLVLSGCAAGPASIRMQNLPIGNGPVVSLPAGAGVVVSGTTAGTGTINQTCGVGDGTAPENTYWWATCGPFAGGSFAASTCGRATWDTVLAQRSAGRGVVSICDDDAAACGRQSTLSHTISAGPGLHALYIDGFGGAAGGESGAYSILYTRP